MEAAYHGKKSDARDRSSEDPRRHTIPRASVSPGPRGDASSGDENADPSIAVHQQGARLRRKKSVEKAAGQRLSRERTLEREKRLSSRSRERGGGTATSTFSEAATASSTFYRVERTLQVSRSFRDAPGMPPIPPARSNSSRRAAVATSTPSKKRPTPYQLWREQRLMSEMRQVSPVPPKVSPTAAFQDAQDPAQKFKKRQRSPSGISNASSTTAEPRRKVVPTAEVAETISIGSNDSEKSSKAKRSLSSLFGGKGKKKSREEQLRKTSTTASLLHGALTLNPDFHKAIVEYNNGSPATKPAAGQQVAVRVSPPPPPPDHVMGTVLKPQLPRGRTPFQEWRHFRQQQKQRELQEEQQQQQQQQVEQPPVPYRHPPSPRLMRTPEPDYDTTSVGSAVSYASSYRSSKEDLRPRQARRP